MVRDKTQLEDGDTTYRVSAKQAFIFASTVITVLGTIVVAYLSNPPDPDVNYADQVKGLREQYVRIHRQHLELIERIEANEALHVESDLLLQRIQTDDSQCRSRINRIEEKVDRHLEYSNQVVNKYDVAFERMKVLLEECMRRTRMPD